MPGRKNEATTVGLRKGEAFLRRAPRDLVRLESSRVSVLREVASKLAIRTLLVERVSDAAIAELATISLPDLRALRLRGGVVGRPGLTALGAASFAPSLASLDLHVEELDSDTAAAIATACARTKLEALGLGARRFVPAAIQELGARGLLGSLRSLALFHDRMQPGVGEDLRRADLTANMALIFLERHPGALGPEGAAAIASCQALASLEALDLRGGEIGAEGAAAIASSTVLRNLRALDLGARYVQAVRGSYPIGPNALGPEGARALAAAPSLGRLRRLALAANGIGTRGARAILASLHLAHVDELDLRDNGIDEITRYALEWRFANVKAEGGAPRGAPLAPPVDEPWWSGLEPPPRLALFLRCVERALDVTGGRSPAVDALLELAWRGTCELPDPVPRSSHPRFGVAFDEASRELAGRGARDAGRVLELLRAYATGAGGGAGALAKVLEVLAALRVTPPAADGFLRLPSEGFAPCAIEGERDAGSRLVRDLEKGTVLARRAAAHFLRALRITTPPAMTALHAARTDDDDDEVRALATDALFAAFPGPVERAEVLVAALVDASPRVRAAAMALANDPRGSCDAATLRPALLRAVDDRSQAVCRGALAALARPEHRCAEVEHRLVRAVAEGRDPHARAMAARALGSGDDEALGALRGALADAHADVRTAAVRALGLRVGARPELLGDVRRALRDADRSVTGAALTLLVENHDAEAALTVIGETLGTHDPERILAHALGLVPSADRAALEATEIGREALARAAARREAEQRAREEAQRAQREALARARVTPRVPDELRPLLDAVYAAPDDDAPRLAYAAALAAHDARRAEYIRLALAGTSEEGMKWIQKGAWQRGLGSIWSRGFVEAVQINLWSGGRHDELDGLALLLREEPVRCLRIRGTSTIEDEHLVALARDLASVRELGALRQLHLQVDRTTGTTGAAAIFDLLPRLRRVTFEAHTSGHDVAALEVAAQRGTLEELAVEGVGEPPRLGRLEAPGGFPELRALDLSRVRCELRSLRAARGAIVRTFARCRPIFDEDLRALAGPALVDLEADYDGGADGLVEFARADLRGLERLALDVTKEAFEARVADAFARSTFAGTVRRFVLSAANGLPAGVRDTLVPAFGHRLEVREATA